MEQKEEVNIQLEENEEIRIPKNEERLRNLWDNYKCSNIQIIGVSKREEEDQEIENLFENIMKENFSYLAKTSRKSRKLREYQRNWTQEGTHQGRSSLSYPRLKRRRES